MCCAIFYCIVLHCSVFYSSSSPPLSVLTVYVICYILYKRHVQEITAKIKSLEPFLKQSGQMACINIMTDGQSSDGNLAQQMAELKKLPVHVVVRLCTDQEDVVEYWNNVDGQLELNMVGM